MKRGTTFVYEGQTENGLDHDEVHVTNQTRMIDGVTCVAVQDTDTVAGMLSEDTTDWFAQDTDGNVWYFGEQAKQYSDGVLVGIEGSWMAGVNDAKPGIVMEANPKVGDLYRQEFAIGVAVGRKSHKSAPRLVGRPGLEPGTVKRPTATERFRVVSGIWCRVPRTRWLRRPILRGARAVSKHCMNLEQRDLNPRPSRWQRQSTIRANALLLHRVTRRQPPTSLMS